MQRDLKRPFLVLLTLVSSCRDQLKSKRTKQEHYVTALMQRRLDRRNWRLVLTGRSLQVGAGAAALPVMALHLSGRFASQSCFPSPLGFMLAYTSW